MTIGNAISQARHEAGLSLAEVSTRTRIRETIISAIEQDNFAPCGGDFYARGHIRAIARVVGLDSRPLIEEYDSGGPAGGIGAPGPPAGTPPAGTPAAAHSSDGIIAGSQWPADTAVGDQEPGNLSSGTSAPAGPEGGRPAAPETIADDVADERAEPATSDFPAIGHDVPDEPPGPATSDFAAIGHDLPDEPPAPPTPDFPPTAHDLPDEPPAPPTPDFPPTAHDLPDEPPTPATPFPAIDDAAILSEMLDHRETADDAHAVGAGHSPGADVPLASQDHAATEESQGTHAAGNEVAGPPAKPSGPSAAGRRDRRRPNWSAVLAVALLAAIGVGAYSLVSRNQSPKETNASAEHPAGKHGTPGSSHPTASPSPAPSAPPAAQTLSPVSVAAFGPDGAGQGDNPDLAQFAVDGNAARPWHTDWYSSPQFGNLQPGTGLLLDMGKTVTVQAAQIAVGDSTGADVELRVGDAPELASLPPAAHGSDAGGTVHLRLTAPAQGRYVLVWFTKLPPNASGSFQASVYDIKLQGHS